MVGNRQAFLKIKHKKRAMLMMNITQYKKAEQNAQSFYSAKSFARRDLSRAALFALIKPFDLAISIERIAAVKSVALSSDLAACAFSNCLIAVRIPLICEMLRALADSFVRTRLIADFKFGMSSPPKQVIYSKCYFFQRCLLYRRPSDIAIRSCKVFHLDRQMSVGIRTCFLEQKRVKCEKYQETCHLV